MSIWRSVGYGAYDGFGTVMMPWHFIQPPASPAYTKKNVCEKIAIFQKFIELRKKQLERIRKGEEIWIRTSYSSPIGSEVPAPPKPKTKEAPKNAVDKALQILSAQPLPTKLRTISGFGQVSAINDILGYTLGGGSITTQLTIKDANRRINNWQRQLNQAQGECDAIMATHGSFENKKRYDHQISQRLVAVNITANKKTQEICSKFQVDYNKLLADYRNLHNLTLSKVRADYLSTNPRPPNPVGVRDGTMSEDERNAKLKVYHNEVRAWETGRNNMTSKASRGPELTAANNKQKAAQAADKACRRDEQRRIKQELEATHPMPRPGDSPCGPMPKPTKDYRERKLAIATRGSLKGFGDFGTSMTPEAYARLRSPNKNLTCCPEEKKWYTHPHGTFFDCPEVKKPEVKKKRKMMLFAGAAGVALLGAALFF